jgi:hypothetical protein
VEVVVVEQAAVTMYCGYKRGFGSGKRRMLVSEYKEHRVLEARWTHSEKEISCYNRPVVLRTGSVRPRV